MCFMASKISTIHGVMFPVPVWSAVKFAFLLVVWKCALMTASAKYWAAIQYTEGPAGFGINSDLIIKCSVLITIWARALLHFCWFALAACWLFILERARAAFLWLLAFFTAVPQAYLNVIFCFWQWTFIRALLHAPPPPKRNIKIRIRSRCLWVIITHCGSQRRCCILTQTHLHAF